MSFLKKQSVRTRILASLTALVLTTGLAGCSDDDDADLEDTANASDVEAEYVPASADGPAQNVPEPSLPAVATENSEEGAEATLQYFWEAVDYARLTGDSSHLDMVSSSSCDFCAGFMEDWQDVYKEGHWAVTYGEAEHQVSETWVGTGQDEDVPSADVLFALSDPAVDLYNESGDVTESSDGSETATDWFAILLYDATAERWQIDWIGVEELVEWEGH